jgi:gluconolactonase
MLRLAILIFTCLPAGHLVADESTVFPKDSTWETVGEGYQIVEGIATDKDGIVYLTDVPDSELIRLPEKREAKVMDPATSQANGLSFGPDGRLYGACMADSAILCWDLQSGGRTRIETPTPANDLAITADGTIFYTWGAANAIYQIKPAQKSPALSVAIPYPNGITLSHDRREVWVGEFFGDTVRAFPIQKDGTLGPSRVAFKVMTPENGKGLIDGMTPLTDGRLLAATALGLQIASPDADPVVLPNPTSHRANYVRILTDAAGQRWIYAAHVKSVIRRRTLL